MMTEAADKETVLATLDQTVSGLHDFISRMDESTMNTIPYENSWTAGQLVRHVTKSTNWMIKAMAAASKPAGRDIGEKIPGLQKSFLDFTSQMKSPDFIVPEEKHYEKEATLRELTDSFEQFKTATEKANLHDLIEGLPFGAVTKLELLHFVLYHTQRHLHQMEKIYEALPKK